jgi:hypothetical protein
VSGVDELLPPQAPKTSNANKGKLRLIVLRMKVPLDDHYE